MVTVIGGVAAEYDETAIGVFPAMADLDVEKLAKRRVMGNDGLKAVKSCEL